MIDMIKRAINSRRLRCYYIVADVVFADTKVRLFFVKRGKNGVWSGLIITNVNLGFFDAYKIYSKWLWLVMAVYKPLFAYAEVAKNITNNLIVSYFSNNIR